MRKLTIILFSICLITNLAFSQKRKSKHDNIIVIETRFGEMHVVLFDETPLHKENFIKLSREGFYNNTTFHRAIKNFMIQGGDPNSKDSIPGNEGQGGPGYTLEHEIKEGLKHEKGSVAAARLGDNINPKRESNGSQFYIVHSSSGTPHLDGAYTVFGKVVKGLEVIDAIAEQKTVGANKPKEDITMTMKVLRLPKKKITKLYGYEYTK
ncbi:MAG: peptidylprolyl isomerase [Cytophagaceae bacterium]